VDAIIEKGIPFTNSARAYARTMCEATIGMMLALGYHMRYSHELYTYDRTSDFNRQEVLGIGLERKTVGIVGLGPIGELIAEMLATFKVRIKAYDPYVDLAVARRVDATLVDDIVVLFEQSDIVTIHCGWTDETNGLVTKNAMEQLGPRGILICNARMPIVDEDALFQLVKARGIYAGLNMSPMRDDLWLDPELKGLPNLLMTHGSTNVSDTWYDQVSRNVGAQLISFFDGKGISPELTAEKVSQST
jgi:D-3-phosphoglycerate dehydrogenase